MAENVADSDQAGEAKPGILALGIILLVSTLLAGGVGFLTGGMLLGDSGPPKDAKTATPAAADAGPDVKSDGHSSDANGDGKPEPGLAAGSIIDLDPIVTNLASPANKWVRLEASIHLGHDFEGNKEELAKQVAEDLLVFLRAISLRHLEGAAGLSHFREDIEQRASVRSDGAVKRVYVKMLVVE
jgi:flagellar FliL protein